MFVVNAVYVEVCATKSFYYYYFLLLLTVCGELAQILHICNTLNLVSV